MACALGVTVAEGYIMKDGKFHKQNAKDEAPAPDPANMPASGTGQLVAHRP